MNSSHPLTSHFPSDEFEALIQVEKGHWWFEARNRMLLWVLTTKAGAFHRFLEVGCGTGYVLEGVYKTFPDVELFGSEYFEEGLVHARKRIPTAIFTQLDATLMTDSDQYDVIGAFDVIEHIEEDEKVLSNLTRALTEHGRLLVSVPQHRWLWSEADAHACHVRRYTKAELVEKMKHAGLDIEYVTSFVCLLVPLMWLSRLKTKKGTYDPMAEFNIPRWLNRCLKAVMDLEFLLLKMGLRLPFGGSLLVLARKS